MPVGPGKYDAQLTVACESAHALTGLLVIFDGAKGPGFSIHGTLHQLQAVPEILRDVANSIEADMRRADPKRG